MIYHRSLFGFALGGLLCLVALVAAHAEAPTITPHRAIYRMSLGTVKNGGSVTDVSGKMFFEWRDSCDGWAVQQRLQLRFAHVEGDESDVSSTIVTWESKDGKQYTFNVRRLTDGKETDYRGQAVTGTEDAGHFAYDLPQEKKGSLPEGTVFPSAHTLEILTKAAAGETLFTRPVFDGSDEDGLAEVSAFLGKALADPWKGDASLQKSPLLEEPVWPVRLAFFKPKEPDSEPDYEMDVTLQGDGIARTVRIDYGNFSVSGVLTHLESLPDPGCSAP